jgi:hypothetical protein
VATFLVPRMMFLGVAEKGSKDAGSGCHWSGSAGLWHKGLSAATVISVALATRGEIDNA